MRWKIEDFIFCDQQQSLTQDNKVQQLEPILVELLSYFCRHPDKIISRDQLVESVWLGRMVTDSAVNRAITKLRRCLGDNPKAPRFIATFPKKGYKFIAHMQLLRPAEIDSLTQYLSDHQPIKSHQVENKLKLLTVAAIICAAIFVLWYKVTNNTNPMLTQVKPLTRSSGQEWDPRISPDQRYLLYTEVVADKMHLFIKQLSNGHTIEINPVDDPKVWVGPASWNSSGNMIVYLVATQDYCRYYLQSFDELTLGEPKLIHNCPAGSYGKIAFTHVDNLLIFAERSTFDSPYVLFEFDLTTGKKRKLNQPPLVLGGNISFDLHPTQNKLLVSSPDEQIWEGFYSVDLDTDEMKLLFKLDSYICCGIWDHSGERVVLMGEHPAVQLISYNLRGEDRQVVYAGSQQLYAPERHPNQNDYLFPAGRRNLDINFLNFDSLKTVDVANSSVDDRLAIVAPQEDNIAYVGLASGSEELWISDIDGKNQRQLTHFSDQRHYLDVKWSPNGKAIAGLALNEIHIIDVITKKSRVLSIPQTEVRSMSFKDDQTLFYSIKKGDQWIVKQYNTVTNEVLNVDRKWQFIRFDADENNTLWIDRKNKLYIGTKAKLVDMSQFNKLDIDIMIGRNFNLRKFGTNWYWQQWDINQYQLYKLGGEDSQANPLIRSDSIHFDICSKGIFYHTAERRNSDIFQTVGLN